MPPKPPFCPGLLAANGKIPGIPEALQVVCERDGVRGRFFGATRYPGPWLTWFTVVVGHCSMPQRFSLETVMKMRQLGDDQWQVAEKSLDKDRQHFLSEFSLIKDLLKLIQSQ